MTKPTPHYYPFGSLIPNRSWSDASREYRYGFNGKEKDFETANDNYDFGARIYDGRLGRWLSLDPFMSKYPYLSPFICCANNPIIYKDKDGKDFTVTIDAKTHTITISAVYYCIDQETFKATQEAALDIMASNGKFITKLKGEKGKYTINFDLQVKLVPQPEPTPENPNPDPITNPSQAAAEDPNGNSIEAEDFTSFDNRAKTAGYGDENPAVNGFTLLGSRIVVRKSPLDPNWKSLYPSLKENIKKEMLKTLGLKQSTTQITSKSILTILNYANLTNNRIGNLSNKIYINNSLSSKIETSGLSDIERSQPRATIVFKDKNGKVISNEKGTTKTIKRIKLK